MDKKENRTTLIGLPNEILFEIASYLDFKELVILSMVSKTLKEISDQKMILMYKMESICHDNYFLEKFQKSVGWILCTRIMKLEKLEKKSFEIGHFVFPNGNIYQGEFKNGQMDGCGIHYFNVSDCQGDVYIGEWKNSKKHGYGKYIWSDGEYYIGDWSEDIRNGFGSYYWNDGCNYIGEWKNGICHGNGVMKFGLGHVYEGCFRKGDRKGKGVLRWTDGDYFKGTFSKGSRSEGILYLKTGESFYQIWPKDIEESFVNVTPAKFL